MVLYSNINLNQRVELIYDNQLLRGTVKYKGAVNNLDGEWIGVSLDMPCKCAFKHLMFSIYMYINIHEENIF